MKKTILGLDVSTSITGASIIHGEKIVKTYIWDLRNKRKFTSLYEKAEFIREKVKEIEETQEVAAVIIEKPFMFFNSGGSSAKTMSTLQSFNGMVSWICRDTFGFDPVHIAVREARKIAGLNIKRGENTKEKVLSFVLDKYPHINVEYTKHGNPRPGVYDMCDSIIIGLAGNKFVGENSTT